ncbi:MAG TPA: preprotein translocase subunit SecY [Bacteroidia bacterium]|jgi:preprotein translocase subunit SecY|nr:preprotein translocase subunit SecY [Bacteroidia bacterium]
MKKFISTIQNIWRIEELRQRILLTLGLILIYRLGSYVVLPGVDATALAEARSRADQSGILALINIFAGGAFSRASIFGLGIMPYITASIIIQLLGMAVPYFQKMQKEGESGRKKINQYTRFLTVGVTAIQAPGYIATQITNYAGVVPNASSFWYIQSILILVTGTIFVMWLGEKITDRGIGNGISLLIMIGIIARLPFAFFSELSHRLESQGGGLIMFLLEIVFLIAVIISCILLVQGTRRIPVQFAKKIVGNKQYGGVRQYVPLKVNAAGVMPIIFAQAIMFIPAAIAQMGSSKGGGFLSTFTNHFSFWYNFVFALLIIAFTYFYTAIMINPNQLADDMKKNGGFIPGVKPGKATAAFIDQVMSRITLPGSIFLALVAIMPAFAMRLGITNEFANFYGGTSLLILVGVVLDTLQQIESYLLNRHYDGLMKSGRIKGRAPAMQVQS